MDPIEKSLVNSRWEKTLIRCPICNKPIGERLNNQWWFLKHNNGVASKVPLTIDQNSPTGSYTVSCWDENCGGGHVFTWVNETIMVEGKIFAELKTED